MRNPLVSVICLCYNHERFVRLAVESVIEQTYNPIQIILADDASDDSSQTIIRQLKNDYPHLEVLLSQENLGNCKAFNKAYALAKGDFVVDFSTDDIMLPDRIQKQVEAFLALDERTGVIFTDAIYIDQQGAFLREHFSYLLGKGLIGSIPEGDVYQAVLSSYFIPSPTMMIRRKVLDDLGGYDETLSYEDFDLWVRSAREFQYAFLNEKLTAIRKLGKSMSTGWYIPGDKQLISTYRVCVKAMSLNRDEADHAALVQRVRYEFRQSVFTGNHREAKMFYDLLKELKGIRSYEFILAKIDHMKLPLAVFRKMYYDIRYT